MIRLPIPWSGRSSLFPRLVFVISLCAFWAQAVWAEERPAANQMRVSELVAPPVGETLADGIAIASVNGRVVMLGGVHFGDEGHAALDAATFVEQIFHLDPLPPPTTRERGFDRIRKSLRMGERIPEDTRIWAASPLAHPVAHAAVASAGEHLFIAGGLTPDGVSAAVRRYTFTDGAWVSMDLPELPQAVFLAGAQILGNRLYVAGGLTSLSGGAAARDMWVLDLREADGTAATWRTERMPYTDGVVAPTLTVRRDEVAIADALFFLGGWRAGETEGRWLPQTEGFKFLPPEQSHAGWTALRPSIPDAALETAIPVGPAHITLLGRQLADGEVGLRELLCPAASDSAIIFKSYHLFTNQWVRLNWMPLGLVAPHLAGIDGRILVAGDLPGEDAPVFREATLFYSERHFSMLDYLAMFLYLGSLVLIGKYFARRDSGTEFFFLGGRKIPWWAAGLSIYATGTSAISFMAIPAKTYMTDWLYFIGMSIFPFFTVILAAYLFIPLLRRLEITTVMEYFDLRFGRSVRFLMSFVSVMGQVAGRMSITLLLPALALSAVTGVDIYLSILVMGVLATIYTVMGGISAVIWTDVLQVGVLFGGAILSFFLIMAHVDGGFTHMIDLAVADNKFNFFDFRPDLTTATMWIMLLWAVSDVFGKGLGQEGLQRAFSTPTVRDARRSMITLAVVALPAGFLFYGIGTALYAFYHQHPELLNPTLQNDAIFPLFIAQQLPVGIAGLVISALFAAAMSTLDTAMNSVSAIVTRDYYSVFNKNAPERVQMRLARWVTITCGVIGTGIALYMASFENLGSLWDRFSILLALIGGGLGGVGALALCTTRANSAGTLLGVVVTSAFIFWLRFHAPSIPGISPLHFFAYGTASLFVGFTTGYLFSVLLSAIFPNMPKRDLTGLTLWTSKRGVEE